MEVLHVVIANVIDNNTIELFPELKLSIAKARAVIIQGLGDKPLRLCYREKENRFKMWERLRNRYDMCNIVTRVQL